MSAVCRMVRPNWRATGFHRLTNSCLDAVAEFDASLRAVIDAGGLTPERSDRRRARATG